MERAMDDLISRKEAIDLIKEWFETDKHYHPYSKGKTIPTCEVMDIMERVPPAEPERLTDADFETIRIHLNAYKEQLCNQHRWEEAEEYQRIIDRFISFASAQPDENKYEYHYDHTDCIWYRPEARNRCPAICAQYRDGWNDAMNYIFRDGKGYRPYRRDKQYEK